MPRHSRSTAYATKGDVHTLAANLRGVESKLGANIQAVQGDVHTLAADLRGVESKLGANIQAVQGDVHTLAADLRGVESKLGANIQAVHGDVHALNANMQAVQADLHAVASKVVEMGERLVILERIESNVRFVAESMTAKASSADMKDADDRLAGRVSLLEDVARQHSEDIRQLRARDEP